jgi:hypothetical protein
MKLTRSSLFATLAAAALAPQASAHFHLVEPPSWIEENNLGDPQKMGPCGGASANPANNTPANPGKPTMTVTRVQGGQKLHIKVQETVFHPGFYRVALSVNSRDELPKDPEVLTKPSDRGPQSVSGKIVYPPTPPVLADGLFQHTAKVAGDLETDIELPNINCAKCTLQIIQFMASHGLNRDGDYSYHHCADIAISADSSKPIDTRFPAEKK